MRLAILLLLQGGASSFTTLATASKKKGFGTTFNNNNAAVLFAAAGESGEEDSAKSTSFDDAGRSIIDEDEQKQMEEMGDFDSNPDYQMESIDRMREAIRKRASDVGAEKSQVSQQYFEDAKRRAQENAANNRPGGLDLSQISSGSEKTQKQKWDEELPTMLYDPTDEMTDAERKEADPVGQLPIWDQALNELKGAKWPDIASALREVALLFVIIALSGVIIIGWDKTLRTIYTDAGMIPTKEEINSNRLDELDLPQGFMNGMSEEDMAKMTEEMNSGGKKSISSSSSPSVDSLVGNTLQDL